MVLVIFLTQVSFAQKADLASVKQLMADDKYEEAYFALNVEKFKKDEKESEEYHYLYTGVCRNLYAINPTLNSAYRNEGTIHAAYLLLSEHSEMAAMGREFVAYFTIRIYNDLVVIVNSLSEDDSINFDTCSAKTLVAFQLFTIPDDWDQNTIYNMGTRFYNDAVYVKESITSEDPIDVVMDKSELCVALFGNAKNYFNVLCNKFQANCEVLEGLNAIFGE